MLGQWSSTALAIALAVVAAGCFAVAAVLQHRAIGHQPLSVAGFVQLLRHRVWLSGLAILSLACLLHIAALILAPVAIVQPIGVLAVPCAVLLAARHSGQRPSRGVVLGVSLCVLSVGTLVWLAAGNVVSPEVERDHWLIAGAVVGGLVAALVIAAILVPRWMRCVACAIAGAVCFGFGSALLRGTSQHLNGDLAVLLTPTTMIMIVGILVAMITGGWLVQQAYAAGPPEIVIACLTVVDPLVAVVLGLTLLAEGDSLGLPTGLAMIGCAVVAAAGVTALVAHHPDAVARHGQPTLGSTTSDRVPVAVGGREERQ